MSNPLFAYLDPSTGSMGYQIAISGFLATLATVRLYWDHLKRFLHRRQDGGPEVPPRKE